MLTAKSPIAMQPIVDTTIIRSLRTFIVSDPDGIISTQSGQTHPAKELIG